jgi:hypothetical protein
MPSTSIAGRHPSMPVRSAHHANNPSGARQP